MGLRRRLRGYKAAFQVETFRAEAERIQIEKPELFAQILSQAKGSEAEEAAARDPVAYVALFLAAARDAGVIDSGETSGVGEVHVSAVLEELAPRLERCMRSQDGEPIQYPEWAARTLVKMELAEVLRLTDDVADQIDFGLVGKRLSGDAPSPEDYERLEAGYDRVFRAHGLTSLVDEVVGRVLLPPE